MIIYNITFHIDNKVLDECLIFFKKEYIPKAIANKILENPRFCKILSHSEDGSTSYSLQFQVKNLDALNNWWKECGNLLNEQLVKRFSEQVMGFTTLLEAVNHEDE